MNRGAVSRRVTGFITVKLPLVFSIVIILLLWSGVANSSSLTGTTGLLFIPTAEMPEDGEISFGLNLLNKKYLSYGDNQYHGLANYVSLGYLPFLEVSLRLTRSIGSPEPQALGDRTICIRLRLFKEGRLLPSIVWGLHDPIGTRYFNALYLVGSKNSRLSDTIKIGFHLGYGVDWMKPRHPPQFVGLFGGVSLSTTSFITFMFEHDAEKFNCGIQMSIFDRVGLLLALLNFDSFSGGASYKFRL